MDALLPAFLAALLAETGDRTQIFAALLAFRFARPAPVLAGIAAAAIANAAIAAVGGTILHDLVNFRALTLMLALALLSAGVGALWRQKRPDQPSFTAMGAFGASAIGMFILEFGDKTQFLTLTLAARSDTPWLAAIGAAAGVVVAAVPAVALAGRFETAAPWRRIRLGIGGLLLLVGCIAAIAALGLA